MRLTVLVVLACLALPSSRAYAQLTRVTSFGANPGALDMYIHVPADLPASAPLVVVLHGCSQTASSMIATGWNDLADELGFAVAYPQQPTANNPIGCFNWAGEYGDQANLIRGQGENQSIVSMVDYMIANHDVDTTRVYVDGFSAGGAFAAVLLATWPDRFRAGAVMSGIPYRCATTVDAAYDCQQLHLNPGMAKTAQQWGDLVRAAHAGYTGPYPRVQIWHGTSDGIVADENQQELIEQWTNVHGTDADADTTENLTGMTRREFKDGGVVAVETYTVTGMGHAVCVGTDDPEHACGGVGAYYEDRGTCSTWRAARFFGLDGSVPGGDDTTPPVVDVIAPTGGASVSGTVTVIVAASDDVGVAQVELAVDGVPVGTDDAAPYQISWSAANAGDGEHRLTATAWDAAGNEASDDDTTVTVAGEGPGGGGDDEPGGPDNDLPGCGGLDAGGGAGGGAAGLLLAAALLRIARRSRARRRRG